MKIKITTSVPKFLRNIAVQKLIGGAIGNTSERVLSDFRETTKTWETKPKFEIKKHSWYDFEISTQDKRYLWVDEGTKPHIIVAKSARVLAFGVGGKPKTTPHVIGSTPGEPGTTMVYTPMVHHPGTEAREFTEEIKKKWDGKLSDIIKVAVDEIE